MIPVLQSIKKTSRSLLIWQALFVLALIAVPVTNYLTLETAMQKTRFVALDSRETVYMIRGGPIERDKQAHREWAAMALRTMYERNPGGFDAPPSQFEEAFDTLAAKTIIKSGEDKAQAFRDQLIHQKVEIGDVQEISPDPANLWIKAEVQLIRTGIFGQIPLNAPVRGTVYLRFRFNDDVLDNGQYPMVVTAYKEVF